MKFKYREKVSFLSLFWIGVAPRIRVFVLNEKYFVEKSKCGDEGENQLDEAEALRDTILKKLEEAKKSLLKLTPIDRDSTDISLLWSRDIPPTGRSKKTS